MMAATKEPLSERGIYYRVNEFRANRPTLVFVHGLTGSSSAWLEYEKKFAGKYNILTFDLRGHGKSDRPRHYKDYEIREFVEDINELIKSLRIGKFTLVSHSFGTLIAMDFLAKHKDQVESAIFLSPIFDARKVGWMRVVHLLIGWLAGAIQIFPFFIKRGGHIDYSGYRRTGDWNLRRMIADTINTGIHVYLYCLDHIYKFNGERYLDQITVPVLIVHGKQDTVMPVKNAVAAAEKIKNCKIILLDNANHIIVLNNAEEVSRAIEGFVAR